MPDGAEPIAVPLELPLPRAEAERIMALIARAEQGDAAVIPELRKVFDQQPRLWQAAGDLAHSVEAVWLRRLAGSNLYLEGSVSRQLRAMRRDLLGEAPSPLERLCADRVCLTWLALNYAEYRHAATMAEQTFAQGEYYQDRIVRYQKLHLAAIKALANLRRVAVTLVRGVAPGGGRVEAARVDAVAE